MSWFGRLARIEAKIDLLHERQQHTMSALDNLQASEAALVAKADALLAYAAGNRDLIAELQARIAALGNVDPAIQAVADQLAAEADKITAFLPAPPPPVPPVG